MRLSGGPVHKGTYDAILPKISGMASALDAALKGIGGSSASKDYMTM